MTMSDDVTTPSRDDKQPDVVAAPRKVSVRIWLDADVLAAFKATGSGWMERINAVLRAAMEAGRV